MQKNRVEVAGHLAAKPETRYLPSGTKVANARLGESYRYTGPDKQVNTQTNWHSLTFYAELADIATTYDKGDNLFIEGTLQQRRFTPKDGVPRTVYEIVVKSCHRIAEHGRGGVATAAATSGRPQEPIVGADEEGDDDVWPV